MGKDSGTQGGKSKSMAGKWMLHVSSSHVWFHWLVQPVGGVVVGIVIPILLLQKLRIREFNLLSKVTQPVGNEAKSFLFHHAAPWAEVCEELNLWGKWWFPMWLNENNLLRSILGIKKSSVTLPSVINTQTRVKNKTTTTNLSNFSSKSFIFRKQPWNFRDFLSNLTRHPHFSDGISDALHN